MRLFLLLLLTITVSVNAQTVVEFSRLGVNEGLSQNSVYAVHQDEQGFLWIGTGDGLNRYDGHSFKIFRDKWGDTSSKNLKGRLITSTIIQDNEKQLWFFTNSGLTVLNKITERFFQPSDSNAAIKKWHAPLKPLGADSHNVIWFLDKATGILTTLDAKTWQDKTVQLKSVSIITDAVMEGSDLYIATTEAFYVYSTALQQLRKISQLKDIVSLHRLSGSKINIQTTTKAFLYLLKSKTTEPFPVLKDEGGKPFPQSPILIYEYPKNIFYLRVAGQGLIRYNAVSGEQTFFKHQAGNSSSLSNNYITTTFVDRSYNLWIGTEGGGLSRLDLKPRKFNSFPSHSVNARQAANLMVKSIFTTHQKILIGTFSQGLYVVDGDGSTFRQVQYSLNNNRAAPAAINFFYKDGKGRLWMNLGNIVGYIDTLTFGFQKHAYLKNLNKNNLTDVWAYSMAEYAPDKFLIGTYTGLYALEVKNGEIKTRLLAVDGPLSGFIQSIAMAPDGTIYLGKIGNGFWHIKLTDKGAEVLDKGFLTTGIRHFYFAEKAPVVWMASEVGLVAYNTQTKKSTVYDATSGLSNSYLYSILPQNDSTLWVSTNTGINKAVVTYSNKGVIQHVSFSAYTQVDGLQSNEFNTGAFYQAKNGALFFGGVNGINWFHPSQIITNRNIPPVIITDLIVNENQYSSTVAIPYLKSIKLPYHKNTLSFHFASLEFTNANANAYAYMLEGFDKDWVYSGSRNEARYANLPYGHYLLKVKASNSDGIWNKQPQTLEILITPAWWQTLAFKIAALLLVAITLALLVRSYINARIRNKVKELEKQKAVNEERLRISRDMHDELGTGLTKIALLSEVSTRNSKRGLGEDSPLQEITATSRALTQKMGEIIWTLNPVNDTLDNLAAYLKEHLYELSEGAGIAFSTSFPTEIPALQISNRQRQHILLVTKEGFNNILKHAQASSVLFSLQIKDKITFTLQDDGRGFEHTPIIDSSNGKRNGLNNMAWRMDQAKGSFSIKRVPEGGTILQYSIRLPE